IARAAQTHPDGVGDGEYEQGYRNDRHRENDRIDRQAQLTAIRHKRLTKDAANDQEREEAEHRGQHDDACETWPGARQLTVTTPEPFRLRCTRIVQRAHRKAERGTDPPDVRLPDVRCSPQRGDPSDDKRRDVRGLPWCGEPSGDARSPSALLDI